MDMSAKGGGGGDSAAQRLLQDPMMLAALQAELQTERAEIMSTLPMAVRKRVLALKKLQVKSMDIEADFYRKVHDLECEYVEKFRPLYEKRAQIIAGSYEPSAEECEFEDAAALAADLKDKAVVNGPEAGEQKKEEPETKGVPEFWLTLFKNVELLADMIQEHDEPILKTLIDVDCKLSKDPMAFVLQFHFLPNDYFTNTVLTKEYTLRCQPDAETPFDFDGPEIVACKGCTIDWKPNKNVTVKLIKKKQKHKQRGQTRFVTKQVKADSFFNFFDPPTVPEGSDALANLDDDTRELLNADFEIGQILRDRIIPRAVLYFTGEAHEDEEFDEDEEEDEGDFDDEDQEIGGEGGSSDEDEDEK